MAVPRKSAAAADGDDRLPLARVRELLGDEAHGMTDNELRELRDRMYAVAGAALDAAEQRRAGPGGRLA